MKRKLVKQGTSTMMISLPSKWIKANKLDKGSEVDVEEKGTNIVIGAKSQDKKELKIEITEESKKDLKNTLTHAYRKGFDTIIINGKNKEVLKEIKLVVSDLLLGFEITDITPNKIIIENISEPTEQKYEIILKKSFQLIEETQELINDAFQQNSFKNLEDITDLKNQQDRFLLFCRRLLIKENSERSIIASWEILNFLMHIEHRYYYLYDYASKSKMEKNSDILELLKELKLYFDYYKKAYYEKDINYIHKINNLSKNFYFGKCISSLEKSKGKSSVILSYIREIYRIIQLGTSPILVELLETSH